jgi:hypothetical protein
MKYSLAFLIQCAAVPALAHPGHGGGALPLHAGTLASTLLLVVLALAVFATGLRQMVRAAQD